MDSAPGVPPCLLSSYTALSWIPGFGKHKAWTEHFLFFWEWIKKKYLLENTEQCHKSILKGKEMNDPPFFFMHRNHKGTKWCMQESNIVTHLAEKAAQNETFAKEPIFYWGKDKK